MGLAPRFYVFQSWNAMSLCPFCAFSSRARLKKVDERSRGARRARSQNFARAVSSQSLSSPSPLPLPPAYPVRTRPPYPDLVHATYAPPHLPPALRRR